MSIYPLKKMRLRVKIYKKACEVHMLREILKFNIMEHEIELHTYVEEGKSNKDAVLIFPGGGYAMLSTDREGVAIANAYYERGFNAFVLHYAVGAKHKYPSHLIDASFAITYLKKNSDKLGIDPERIFTVGFSAGGHLSGSMAILHKDPEVLAYLGIEKGDNKPCGSILAYPVVSANVDTHEGSFVMLAGKPFCAITPEEKKKLSIEDNVDEDSAPVFIWHTSNDSCVPVLGSLKLAEAYYSIGRAVTLHVYPYGPHGIALANEETSCGNSEWVQPLAQGWVDESVRWIKAVKSY